MHVANEDGLTQHVSIVGWLFIIGNALFLVIGAFVFILLTGVGMAVRDPEARAILPLVGSTIGVLLVTLSLPGLAAGYGLLTRKPWARVLGIVVAILGLLNFPIGTAIGVYALWVLLPIRTGDDFTTSERTLAPRVPAQPPAATPSSAGTRSVA